MKKVVTLLFSFLLALQGIAQKDAKHDIILKTNGDELTGKVTEIGDTEVKFVYAGESLSYTIKKADILKITFSSGRIEFFSKSAEKKNDGNEGEDKPSQNAAIGDHRNKVAVLPFRFLADKQSIGEDMGYQVQNECYAFLSKHAGELTIIDPRTTNALLIKAGADQQNIRGFTMSELCSILGVEYLIDGSISQNKTNLYNSQSQSYNSKQKNDNNKKSSTGSSYSSGTSTQNYETSLTLSVITDTDRSIFNESRQSFWHTEDAYKNALQYLLKRCPLYRK